MKAHHIVSPLLKFRVVKSDSFSHKMLQYRKLTECHSVERVYIKQYQFLSSNDNSILTFLLKLQIVFFDICRAF